jgi:hypothetical protein
MGVVAPIVTALLLLIKECWIETWLGIETTPYNS